jgi:phospholipase/carboxylesterase
VAGFSFFRAKWERHGDRVNSGSVVVQRSGRGAGQLLLLFHGAGATPEDLVPAARTLADAFPNAFVVSVKAPHAGDSGLGFQWYSVAGVTEANRAQRVAQAMPAFLETVAHWQAHAGLGPEATALIGFSQGAIMALEATKADPIPAGRVVALAGRFAELPTQAAWHTTIHLIHGKDDGVIAYARAIEAAERLLALGADVTADVLPFVGHAVADEMAALVVERLQHYLPQWRWREALQSDPGA